MARQQRTKGRGAAAERALKSPTNEGSSKEEGKSEKNASPRAPARRQRKSDCTGMTHDSKKDDTVPSKEEVASSADGTSTAAKSAGKRTRGKRTATAAEGGSNTQAATAEADQTKAEPSAPPKKKGKQITKVSSAQVQSADEDNETLAAIKSSRRRPEVEPGIKKHEDSGKKTDDELAEAKVGQPVRNGKTEADTRETVKQKRQEKAAVGKKGPKKGKAAEKGPKSDDLRESEVDGVAVDEGTGPSSVTLQLSGMKPQKMKLISWNVAGIRAWIKKKAHEILKTEMPDMFGLQETKCTFMPEEMRIKGYHHYLESPVDKAGHAGVMLLTKYKPSAVVYGSELYENARGRLIILEFEKFYLVNGYVPNSGRGLVNLQKRKEWEDWFLEEIKKMDAKKPVILIGDLNVAHEEIDLANPKTNRNKTAGFTDQERNDFTRLLDAGFVDVYRKLNPKQTGAYTFWSTMHGARATNVGWRLDYFVVSERIFSNVISCRILSDVQGSDHCPIALEIEL